MFRIEFIDSEKEYQEVESEDVLENITDELDRNDTQYTVFKICKECEGEGEYEVMKYCFKPMSECCGGCTETVECEECEGEGHYEYY